MARAALCLTQRIGLRKHVERRLEHLLEKERLFRKSLWSWKLSLPPPDVSIDAGGTRQEAELLADFFQPGGAPEAFGPVAQNSGDRAVVTEHN